MMLRCDGDADVALYVGGGSNISVYLCSGSDGGAEFWMLST